MYPPKLRVLKLRCKITKEYVSYINKCNLFKVKAYQKPCGKLKVLLPQRTRVLTKYHNAHNKLTCAKENGQTNNKYNTE